MKILFIASYSGTMGANRSMLQLMKELQNEGHSVHALIPDKGLIVPYFERDMIQYHVSPYFLALYSPSSRFGVIKGFIKFILNIALYIIAFLRLYKLLKNIDIIHTNSTAIHIGEFFSLLTNKPHIVHLREYGKEDYGLEYLWGNRINRLIVNNFSSAKISISKDIQNHYRNKGYTNIFHIYNGIPEDKFFINSPNKITEKYVILCMGVISKQKNQEQIIDALNVFKKNKIDISNIIVKFLGPNDSDYGEYLKNKVDLLGLDPNVSFEGMIYNIEPYFHEANFAIVPSKREAFGRVTIEFMANYIPVIVSNQGANIELVKHQESGLIYDIDNLDSLVSSIKLFLKNEQLRQEIAFNGAKIARLQYSSTSNTRNILKLYRTFL